MFFRTAIPAVLLAALALTGCDDQSTTTADPTYTPTPAPVAASTVVSAPTVTPASTPTPVPTPISVFAPSAKAASSVVPTPTLSPALSHSQPLDAALSGREIPPCTPVPGTSVDPCELDAPRSDMTSASYIPDLGDAPWTVRDMLEDEIFHRTAHLVARGTYLPNTVRCTIGDPFRPPVYAVDGSNHSENDLVDYLEDFYSLKCYTDMRVNSYILGNGPSTLSVIFYMFGYREDSFATEDRTGQEGVEEVRQAFEIDFADALAGREHVVLLTPSFDLSSLAWMILGARWDVQRKEDGTIIAVHPDRDLWLSLRPDDYPTHRAALEMTLPALTQAITQAHQARLTEHEGRIGADSDLPMLVSNANQLRQFYTAARLSGFPDDPAPPPPLCGLAKSDQPDLIRDCKALLAAKDTLRGTATLNWSADTATTSWDGITVKGKPSRVAEIILTDKSLDGSVPAELAELTGLQILHLYENQLTGSIPSELGSLTALTDLRLYDNRLTGTIPSELGSLTALTDLRLYENQLTGPIPSELGSLTALTDLRLYDNRLTGSIPSELGSLTALTDLRLYDNQLSGGIPSELGSLSNLVILYLDGNQLTGAIPTELGNLSNLVALHLDGNQLTGTIPTELGGLSNLRDLFLGRNQLTGGIPTQLGNLSSLSFLNLDGNQLTGAIPTQLGSLTNMQDLSLSNNRLTGGIPTQLGDLTKLRDLFLNGNQLTGSIPTQLGKLANLQVLDLRSNQLTGSIPSELGKLSKLETLYLHSNQLTGAIPAQLGNLTNLETLWLSGNTLTGCIPAALRNIDNHDLARLQIQYCATP